jgi:hypothetical protein
MVCLQLAGQGDRDPISRSHGAQLAAGEGATVALHRS